MHEYTPEAAQAIESRSRQFRHTLLVDWGNNGKFNHELTDLSEYVTRTSRDQAISSTAPDELMLIEGYGSASLQVEVAGEYQGTPLTGHFSPYNGRSVFYSNGLALGVSMQYSISVWTDHGWEEYRQFTGVVREVTAIREQGIVKLDCADNVERMRTTLDIPAYAGHVWHLEQGYKRGGLVDSSSLIDLAARSAGFTMGPKPGPKTNWDEINTILSVPFHGSILPEVGMLDNAQKVHLTEKWENESHNRYRSEMYTAGPHGYLALSAVPKGQEADGFKNYWLDEQVKHGYRDYGAWAMSAWVYFEGNGASNDCVLIDLRSQQQHWQLNILSNGQVEPRFKGKSGTLYWNADTFQFMTPGWNYVEARVGVFGGSGRVICQSVVNGVKSPVREVYPGPIDFVNDRLSGLVQISNYYTMSDVEVIYSPITETIEEGWIDKYPHDELVGNAQVSWGRNRVMYTLKQKYASAWDLAKDVASAEYGVVMFDEFGKFQFWNFEDVTNRYSSVQRYFDLSDVEGLSLRTTMDSVRNTWTVTTRTGRADWGIAYDLASDGPPLLGPQGVGSSTLGVPAKDAIFRLADFRIWNTNAFHFFWLRGSQNLMCPNVASIPSLPELGEWNQHDPYHAKKVYRGPDYVPGTFPSEQKWVGNDLIRLTLHNGTSGVIGFWLESKDQGRFRMGGTVVYEDEPATWQISTSDVATDPDGEVGRSISRYGERMIELKGNFWLQDRFQTEAMLRKVIQKFGRPTPVTDAITVAGDPRIQIGDVIEVNDWQAMGERVRLQIYGITRNMENGSGLTDTYQVEVIETPGEWIIGSPSYSVLGQSTILA